MRLTLPQKFMALLGGIKAGRQIKNMLIYNYYKNNKKTFRFNYPGVDVSFCTDDYYSTVWFYLQSQVENYIYEPTITQLLVNSLGKRRCFADVGANLGYFTTIAAKVRPDIPIYAFELDGLLTPLIERNLKSNGLTNATVVNAAVGDRNDASVSFTPHAYSFLSMVSGVPTGPFDLKLATKTLRLDDYFADKSVKPDFMKVDIDGAEMAMLRGAEGLLAQDDLEMLLEVHTHMLPQVGSSTAEVLEFLHRRGFHSYRIRDFRRGTGTKTKLEDVTDRPEDLVSVSGDMLYVSRNPSLAIKE